METKKPANGARDVFLGVVTASRYHFRTIRDAIRNFKIWSKIDVFDREDAVPQMVCRVTDARGRFPGGRERRLERTTNANGTRDVFRGVLTACRYHFRMIRDEICNLKIGSKIKFIDRGGSPL